MSWRLRKRENIYIDTIADLLAKLRQLWQQILDTDCYGICYTCECVGCNHKELTSSVVNMTQISLWSLESSQLILQTKHLQTSMVIVT